MKGILFKEPMFRAVIQGLKTETRRLVVEGRKPKYVKGDVVYLSEPFAWDEDKQELESYKFDLPEHARKGKTFVSPLFLPARSARYYINITDVRTERLQDIDESGAIAEGVNRYYNNLSNCRLYEDYLDDNNEYERAIDSFRSLWEMINGPDSWFKNPLVYVYSFRLVDQKNGILNVESLFENS